MFCISCLAKHENLSLVEEVSYFLSLSFSLLSLEMIISFAMAMISLEWVVVVVVLPLSLMMIFAVGPAPFLQPSIMMFSHSHHSLNVAKLNY